MIETQYSRTLCKKERLFAQKRIDSLFESGLSFIAYPLRVVYSIRPIDSTNEESNYPVSIMVSVSKRKFKRAVKRNRVKRLVREAYRLNKHKLIASYFFRTNRIDIAFLYLKDELPTYDEIEKAILKTFSILEERLQQKDETETTNP